MAMAVAGFTAGEAEELRRAMGFKRSAERMQAIERRLRAGMAARGITGKTADDIVRSITAFALYGFPESHAASFALLAYASAYLRAHHLAAFTCAMLNNWPLGFYHPATLVQDAQRHGLRVLPIDVTRSGWKCSLEQVVGLLGCEVVTNSLTTNNLTTNVSCLALRLGLRYVSGLREETGKRIATEREHAPFASVADVAARCGLRDNELATLAHIGAFAPFGITRRAALWQAAAVQKEPLLRLLGCYENMLLGERLDDMQSGNLATNNVTTNNLECDYSRGHHGDSNEPRAIISRTPRVAPSDGFGKRLLFPDQGIPEGGAVRPQQPNSSGSGVYTGEHRRGDGANDAEGFCEFSPHRTGQPPGTGNASATDRGGGAGKPGNSAAPLAAGRVRGQIAQPPDPVDGETGNLTTNNVTTNNLPSCPLPAMSPLERTLADYKGTGMTVGPHLMTYLRSGLANEGVLRAGDLANARDGHWVKIAGLVIVRQRPGTAKGFCFITLEDETGISNAVIVPDMFQRYRALIHTAAILLIEGPLQKVDSVIHVRARRLRALSVPQHVIQQRGNGYRMRTTPDDPSPPLPRSHDFR